MAAFNKFNCFVADVASGKHQMQTGSGQTFRVYLTNNAPAAADTGYSGGNDLPNGNGYAQLGVSIGVLTGSQTGGVFSFSGATNPSWTAAGGSIGPFRYAILYNATASGVPVVGWWDYGASITLTNGNTFSVTLPSPILTIT
ncbi:hypothetical protein [Bradyrhizobium ivorense]|uniref:hypothetical protein n=1 Tax=Bradyrhizobium ivorense TaxID=2511166 RepID=UPI0010B90FD6|nr:hypothetical protein [Bradyrhizobium ivorense]VIO73895.1 hypothetical protein CI41S_40040 [Bradyrhizobium ivorense]